MKSGNVTIVVLLTIIISIAIISGFYWWNKSSGFCGGMFNIGCSKGNTCQLSDPKNPNAGGVCSPINVKKTTNNQLETSSDERIFSNEFFSLKHPPLWTENIRGQDLELNYVDKSLRIDVNVPNSYLSMAINDTGNKPIAKGQKEQIAGLTWETYLHLDEDPGEMGDGRPTLLLINQTNKVIRIIHLANNPTYTIEEDFIPILSTLKFL